MAYRLKILWLILAMYPSLALAFPPTTRRAGRHDISLAASDDSRTKTASPGKILVLGGTGFLGQAVCKRALEEGFQVTSLSRRGLPLLSDEYVASTTTLDIDYRQGDARKRESISNILQEGGYTGIIHCVGLLLDEESGLSTLNKFASGSGSEPDKESTYDKITRLTAFNAIDVALEYAIEGEDFSFCFTSAAEAGWPDVPLGDVIEGVAPDFLKRYLVAKRAVEAKLMESSPAIRPIIVRPSLIYSPDRPLSFLSVGAFFVGNAIGLPFMDRPVTVQALAAAIVHAVKDRRTTGVLRYMDIDRLGGAP